VDDLLARIWGDMVGRIEGPMTLRLVLQPTMAAIFAIKAGLQDARRGRPAYFWTILADPAHAAARLKEGWTAIAKVFAAAVVVDAIYQAIALRWFYLGEALFVAFVLAFVPYLLLRGPVNQIARVWLAPSLTGGR
jgi:hypothetical protein